MTKKKKVCVIIISVVSAIVISLSTAMAVMWSGVLSKQLDDENLAFRILQLTDTHFMSSKKDDKALKNMENMIVDSSPDLIVITGDLSSNKENESDIKKVATFMESMKLPWTITFGNHDAEGAWKKVDIDGYLNGLEHCTYQSGDIIKSDKADLGSQDSYGNYYQLIRNESQQVIQALFFMDSNMYELEQINWYEEKVKEINLLVNNNVDVAVPSLAFFHIPMAEYETAYNEGERLSGGKMEDVFHGYADDQMFETMVKLGSTKGVFVGHDHMNSYAALYKGIRLSYGYSTDHNIYFVMQKGGTVINIKNDGTFTQQGIYKNLGVGKNVIDKAF